MTRDKTRHETTWGSSTGGGPRASSCRGLRAVSILARQLFPRARAVVLYVMAATLVYLSRGKPIGLLSCRCRSNTNVLGNHIAQSCEGATTLI